MVMTHDFISTSVFNYFSRMKIIAEKLKWQKLKIIICVCCHFNDSYKYSVLLQDDSVNLTYIIVLAINRTAISSTVMSLQKKKSL